MQVFSFMVDVLSQFKTLDSILQDAGLVTSASYTHGVITAFMSTGINMQGRIWLEPLIEGARKKGLKKLKSLLLELYELTFKTLVESWAQFELLVPAHESLENRARAVSEWCDGYLYGLALGGIQDLHLQNFSEEEQEMVERFVEISQLDLKSITISQEDETAFRDLYDYIRDSVLDFFTHHSGNFRTQGENEFNGLLH